MAGNNIKQFNIPEGENPDWAKWQMDSGIDYAIYGGDEKAEGNYVNQNEVDAATAEQAKRLQVKLAWNGLSRLRKEARAEQKMAA